MRTKETPQSVWVLGHRQGWTHHAHLSPERPNTPSELLNGGRGLHPKPGGTPDLWVWDRGVAEGSTKVNILHYAVWLLWATAQCTLYRMCYCDVFLKIMAPDNSLTFHSIHFHSFFPCLPLPLLYLPVPPYSFPYLSYTLHLPYLFYSLSLLILCLLPPLPPQCWWAWRCYPEGIPWFRGYTAPKIVKTATPPVE
jgi:hypothetical protein